MFNHRAALRIGAAVASGCAGASWLALRAESQGTSRLIPANDFYGEYRGHRVDHLKKLHDALRGDDGSRPIIWLAGDSSLDNKHWLLDGPRVPAIGGLERVITPPVCVPDVAHQLAAECKRRGLPHGVINASVEESTLGMRSYGLDLLPQDIFLRDHLRSGDIIIVSAGGNDVALRPTPQTVVSMASLAWFATRAAIADGSAFGMGHLSGLYTRDAAAFVRELTSRCSNAAPGSGGPLPSGGPSPGASPAMPACVALCTIYFPDENSEASSWASNVLYLLGYDSRPGHLQEVIRAIHAQGVSRVTLPPPLRLVPVPLFAALDGKDTADYAARVEPSAQGGAKLARLLLDATLGAADTHLAAEGDAAG